MRNLNQKQEKWVMNNTPIGTVLTEARSVEKIVGHEQGYVIIEVTTTFKALEDNYNMGLITKEEFLSGDPKVIIRKRKLSYDHPEWKTYFPELKNIKSK
jgi:hypothetical protein